MNLESFALNSLSQYSSSDEDVETDTGNKKRGLQDAQTVETVTPDYYPTNKWLKNKNGQRLPKPQIECKNLVGLDTSVPESDPNHHDGRIRSFAHERGNWATYVYIPYERGDGVGKLLSNMRRSIADLHEIEHFHISLTKTVVLRHHWIDSFIQSIGQKLSTLRPFVICFNDVAVYCNEERTRTFIGLRISSGFDTLRQIVEQFDRCLAEFALPLFYKNPSFHMSIAWSVGDHEQEFTALLPTLRTYLHDFINVFSDECYILATNIQCKCGNKLFNVYTSSS